MSSKLVHLLHPLQVVHGHVVRLGRVLDEEGVMSVSGRMLLWLKQRVEVPERTLDEVVGGHFTEAGDKGKEVS